MNRHSLEFWLWPIGAALGIALCVGLDIFLIASGVVPAVPGLVFIFVFPAVAGLLVGFGNRSASVMDLPLIAVLSGAASYGLMVAVSIIRCCHEQQRLLLGAAISAQLRQRYRGGHRAALRIPYRDDLRIRHLAWFYRRYRLSKAIPTASELDKRSSAGYWLLPR